MVGQPKMNANKSVKLISYATVEMNRPMRYSGVRAEEYETIKAVKKYIEPDVYQSMINNINRRQRAANKQVEKASAKREEKAKAERERIDKMLKEAADKKKNVIVYRKEIVPTIADIKTKSISIDKNDLFVSAYKTIDNVIKNPLIKAFSKLKHKDVVYFQISQGGEIVVEKLVNINTPSSNAEAIYYDNFISNIVWYEDGGSHNILQNHRLSGKLLEVDTPIRIVVLRDSKVPAKRIKQKYADGGFCVLDPLIVDWKEYAQNAESESSKKRLNQIVKKLMKFKEMYPNGVPENNMVDIAKTICRCIVIYNIVGDEYQKFNDKSPKIYKFTNTKRNHVESGEITLNKRYQPVTQERLIEIMQEHDEKEWYYHFEGDIKTGVPRALKSIRGCWSVFNEDYDIYTEFSQVHNIKSYALDALKYSHVNDFVYEGRLINSTPLPLCDNPNDISNATHIDIEKAYTQHNKAPYFMGFPCALTHHGKIDYIPEGAIGMFQVIVKNVVSLVKKTGLFVGYKYILTVPEIKYFESLGCEFSILAGAFGCKSFDIKYTDEMLQKKRYATWAGKLSMNKSDNMYTFKADKAWAKHLKSVLGNDNVKYFEVTKMCVIRVPKKKHETTHHILSYITAYTRLNMFEIMRKIPEENLIKVILDGVYFKGEVPSIDIPYKEKECISHLGFRDGWYFRSEFDTNNWIDFNPDLYSPDGVVVLGGAGGTGKSHSVLSDSCIISPLYVAPTHVLGQKMNKVYKKRYQTINRMAGVDCIDYIAKKGVIPGCMFIDELTMIDKAWINTVLDKYKSTFIFLAGDIEGNMWFQTRNGTDGKFNEIWTPGDKYKTVMYLNDYRARDDELKKLKIDIRAEMKRIFTDGGRGDAQMVKNWLFDNYHTVSGTEALKMHKDGDLWIAGTHDTNKKLLERGIVSGFKNHDGYIDFNKGDEKRGSFTIHSFQGWTVSDKKIFICPDVFEYAMTYTAISRAVSFDQIVIIRD
jgi:hypothetical protein